MDTLLQDIRYGARMLFKKPGFTIIAVISLALGIGANTTIFSVVNALLLMELPYTDPDRIVLVWGQDRVDGTHRDQVSSTDIADYRTQNTVFEEIAVYDDWRPILSGDAEAERVPAVQVSDGYFSVMKTSPLLGRVFTPEEQEDGKDFVIVLSYGLWQRRFGGDPNIIGKTVLLNSRVYTVVGVMPAGFQSLPASLVDAPAELYRPVAEPYNNDDRGSRHVRAIGRLKPDVDLTQARAEMDIIAARLEQQYPEHNTGRGISLMPLHEDMVGGLRDTMWLLLGAVGFVLLIACANVANLLLARSATRQKEIAIRAALGAARMRLVRQFLTESTLLALIAGALGLIFALWGTGLVEALGKLVIPSLSSIEISSRVLGFTFLISLLTGLAFGLAPALQASRPDLNQSLKEGVRGSGAGSGRNPLRSSLVVAEVAMALVLLIAAGLLIKSVARLYDLNPGFNPRNVLTMNMALPGAKYPDGAKWTAFYDQLTERLESLPGVEAAGVTSVLPLSRNFDGRGIEVEGQPKSPGEFPSADLYITTAGYLRAFSIPVVKGRSLTEQDKADAPLVTLVNETMAERFWPGEDPIGKRIRFPGSSPSDVRPWREVVGVVNDVKQRALDKESPMQFYLPNAQFPTSFMTLVVRTSSDPVGAEAAVRAEILAMDKDQAAYNIASMEEVLSDSISLRRFSMVLLGGFAAVALVLATVGIYGVISYTVTQRTHEIGIRMALGASRGDVLRLVVGQGVGLTLIGVSIGVGAAILITRLLTSLLFAVSATDPTIFIVISVLLTGVALVASYIPARRATRVDPMVALRYE